MLETLTDEARRYLQAAMSSSDEMSALVSVIIAAALVLAGSFVKTMIPLRWLAVGSNVGFIAYGALHPSYPMLLLHAALLPINIIRLVEMKRLTRRVESVRVEGALSSVWLRPYMRSKRMRKGSVLFRKGDLGDRLYLLAEGEIEFTEIKRVIGPGQIFGEIAFFSPDHRRLLSARCATHCTVLSIDEETVKQLYYQNPAFGFKIIELVAERFSADVVRANARADAAIAELEALKRERGAQQRPAARSG
ncbi:MAG TPA: cyclic nucleotide-binding domain-containing protein [Burkholderiaceae bacterium]|nr:cyclic nucleotide-binding domain-containing protein [Burkholderiaceae bacterium]